MSRPRLYDVPRVAEELTLSETTIWRLIRAGKLPVVKLGDSPTSPVRIPADAVDDFIAARTRPATAGPLAGK